MAERKVLYVVHNHPALHPGGAEAYALELYHALRGSSGFEPILLARVGPNVALRRSSHPGTPFSVAGEDPNQYFVFTETAHYDFFLGTSRDKSLYTRHFADFLRAHCPDIVHFQHTLFLGYDLISQVRRTLPAAPIVYTLHEYLPICHRDGQMVRTVGNERCLEANPRRCNECFPDRPPQEFFLRERFIRSHFAHVDLFLAPSRFLLERYVDWGLPEERLRFEEYGRRSVDRVDPPTEDRSRTRLGFFGQLNPFKGADVLLEAMRWLAQEESDVHLWLHGGNLELQSEGFRAQLARLLEEAGPSVTFAGPYEHRDLPRLMSEVDWVVVPSVWWENSPLVIQEAFMHGRPVICSDIGGMAEKVEDGVSGLHFRAGDPTSLARTIERAVRTPGLWEELRDGVPDVHAMDRHVAELEGIYEELLRTPNREERSSWYLEPA